MNLHQHFLLKLIEECNEVSIEVSKIILFRADNVKPGEELTNLERCHKELDDLNAVIEVLNENHYFNYVPNMDNINSKKEKLREFLNKSIECKQTRGED